MASLRAMVAFRCSLSEGGGDPDCRAIQGVMLRESGASSTLRLFGSIISALWIWITRFRGRWRLSTRLRSRGAMRPRLARILSLQRREQGMPGARCTRGLVCKQCAKNAHEHTGTAEHSGIPCAMALRLMPCSPRRRIRLASVVGELAAHRARSGSTRLRQLDTSNGCQDHTVLPYAAVFAKGFAGQCTSRSFNEGGNSIVRLRALIAHG